MSSHLQNKPMELHHGGRGSLGWRIKAILGAHSRGSSTLAINANDSSNNVEL